MGPESVESVEDLEVFKLARRPAIHVSRSHKVYREKKTFAESNDPGAGPGCALPPTAIAHGLGASVTAMPLSPAKLL